MDRFARQSSSAVRQIALTPVTRWDAETVRTGNVPTVIVVSSSKPLADICRDAASRVGAVIVEAEAEAARALGGRRPFALAVSEDVYVADPQAYVELARDLGATLVQLPLALPGQLVEAALRRALLARSARLR